MIALTWDGAAQGQSLADLKTPAAIREAIERFYPGGPDGRYTQNAGQWKAFLLLMAPGDVVAMPRKHHGTIALGEIVSGYEYHADSPDPFRHARRMKWIEPGVARVAFDQDILNSLGAMSTICRIQRNDAEARVRSLLKRGWENPRSPVVLGGKATPTSENESSEEAPESIDPAQLARNQIRTRISTKFVNHEFTRLIDSILRAQGYITIVSPPGPDRGVDILAGTGALGFGEPRLCVQVKSGSVVVDRPTLSELVGVKARYKASHGLLVSWGGFKRTIEDERRSEFFHVRFWDAERVIDEVFANYERLDEDIRERLPLTRIWTLDATLIDENG